MTQTPTAQNGPSAKTVRIATTYQRGHLLVTVDRDPDRNEVVDMEQAIGKILYGAKDPPAGARDAVTDSIYLRGLVGKLAQWQLCMSYNDSYFGEPAGMVKQVVTELARAVDPIYPPMPEPVDPLAGVTIYTATQATQPAAPETTNSTKVSSKLVVGNTAAPGMGDAARALSVRMQKRAIVCEHEHDVAAMQEFAEELSALAAQPAPVVGGGGYVEQHARDSKELRRLCESRDFYKRRCDALQAVQSNMRDPERKAVCDILANGSTELLSARPGGERDELKAYEAWFDGEQGKAYDGMKAFARAAWIARAAHPSTAGGKDR